MTSLFKTAQTTDESQISEFFQESAGKWRSQRRYYTLPKGETKEIESIVTIDFLEQGCDELQKLAQMHDLLDAGSLICGAAIVWESTDVSKTKKESQGSTIFGVKEIPYTAIAVLPYLNQSPPSIISPARKHCVCELNTTVQCLKKS